MQPNETTTPVAPSPLPQQASMAILFADVCGSTKLYETHGDTKARKMIAQGIELMTQAAQSHGGALIKTIGDEVMCRFPTADDAAAAALDMQERVSGAALTGGGLNLAIHVGFHYGPVVREEEDIFGDAVNVAARMVNLSKRDQVLTTGATVAELSPNWRQATRQVDRAAVRGKSEEIDVYEVVWQEAEVTRIAGRSWEIPLAGPPGRLVLTQGAREVEVSEKHPAATVGRADQSDLVMRSDQVSRLHARIEYRNGRFALTDQSTNGTYVTDHAGTVRFVRHDTQVLTGTGSITLGHKPETGQTDLIHFALSG
jgi:class 3 adenylate cyclase